MNLIRLADVETSELLACKQTRKRVEYYWTLTPFCPRWVFESDESVERVTYLDADMFFLMDPSILINEFTKSEKDVMITDHAYDIEYDLSNLSGRYCVQFISVNRGTGEEIMSWWQNRCIEWCYARFEDGKFGDQKYLEQFENIFPGRIHVSKQQSFYQAPWNARRFYDVSPVVYHFHGLRLLAKNRISLYREFYIPLNKFRDIYSPYVECLRMQIALINKPIVQDNTHPWRITLLVYLKFFFRAIQKRAFRNRIIKI
jgi:hypothetical protein